MIPCSSSSSSSSQELGGGGDHPNPPSPTNLQPLSLYMVTSSVNPEVKRQNRVTGGVCLGSEVRIGTGGALCREARCDWARENHLARLRERVSCRPQPWQTVAA